MFISVTVKKVYVLISVRKEEGVPNGTAGRI
jgi:hypothetical protein